MSAIILLHTWLDWDQILKKDFVSLFKAKETKHTVIFQAWHTPWLAESATLVTFNWNKWKVSQWILSTAQVSYKKQCWGVLNPLLTFVLPNSDCVGYVGPWVCPTWNSLASATVTALISFCFLFTVWVEQASNYTHTSSFLQILWWSEFSVNEKLLKNLLWFQQQIESLSFSFG